MYCVNCKQDRPFLRTCKNKECSLFLLECDKCGHRIIQDYKKEMTIHETEDSFNNYINNITVVIEDEL